MQEIEDKRRQFLIEKIIHGVEFKNSYNTEIEKKKLEIIETVEHNYKIVRRVYQQLWLDVSELFADFKRSIDSLNLQEMDKDIKSNGWGIKKNN